MALSDDQRAEITALVRDELARGGDPERHTDPAPAGPAAPLGPVSARLGFPVHALVSTVPLGAFACSFIFDIAAHVAPEPYTYPRSSYWLLVIGLLTGIATGVVGILDHRRLIPGGQEEGASQRHLILSELALLGYVLSFFLRRQTDFIDAVPIGIVVVSGVSLVALFVGAALGARLSYGLGGGPVTAPEPAESTSAGAPPPA